MNRFLFTLAIFPVFSLTAASTSDCPRTLEFWPTYQQLASSSYPIKAARTEVLAAEADRWQAGAYPNPALAVNLNSIGVDQDGDENELYVGFAQLIELGGKRAARLSVAHANQCSSLWDIEVAKNELYAKLQHAFIAMAGAQERTTLAAEQQKIAEETWKTITIKSSSGNSSGLEEKKAQVAYWSGKLEYQRQCSHLQLAKKQLTALWNSNPPQFDAVAFPIYELAAPPLLTDLAQALKKNPELIKAEAEAATAQEIVALEKSRSVPDLAFQVGVTTERFIKEPAITAGFTIPLPIFDQNEGNISRASFEQLQAVYSQLDLEKDLHTSLEVTYHEWTSAYQQALFLKESILPSAESSFRLAQKGYDEGKLDYLELLDARSTLFDIQQQYLDAIEEYHHKRTEVQKMTATCPYNFE